MVALLLLAAAAPFLARDRRATLLASVAFVLLLVPVATQVYDARYALDALGPSARPPRLLPPSSALEYGSVVDHELLT